MFSFAMVAFAFGHGPGENLMTVDSDGESLEVVARLSIASAAALLPAEEESLTAYNFDQHHASLIAAAGRVCRLVDEAGCEIKPERTFLFFQNGHEACFYFFYPQATRPKALHMDLLKALPATYYCSVADQRVKPGRSIVLGTTQTEWDFQTIQPTQSPAN